MLALVIAAFHVRARLVGARRTGDLSKAVPIALLCALVVVEPAPIDDAYRWLVVAALLLSLAGDVCLLFPQGFVPGLASFLVAHLLYVAAFAPAGGWDAGAWLLLIPFALGSLGMLRYLWPGLGGERLPVTIYVGAIALMGWRAAVRAMAPSTPAPSGSLALAGALLFMLSDGLLATNRFARPFRSAEGAVMTTYYAAQTLLALSVRA